MEEEFKNKLSKYIKEDTGYLEELKVANIFSKAGWGIRHSNYYLDKDEGKGREIDIFAYKSDFIKNNSLEESISIHINLVCEVKKSIKKPWIIFSTKKSPSDNFFGLSIYYEKNMKNIIEEKIEWKVDRNSSISSFERIGETYCEAFVYNSGKNDNQSQIFKSLTSSTKASEYFLSIRKSNLLLNVISPKSIEFFEPVIVFKGQMFEAYLNDQDELELNEINHIPIIFNRISPNYDRHDYLVDVVKVEELSNLLAEKEKWFNTIIKKIKE